MITRVVPSILTLMAIATEAFYFPQPMRLQQRRPITLNSREVSQTDPQHAGGVPLKGKSKCSFQYPFLGEGMEFRYRIDQRLCVTLDFAIEELAYSVDFHMWKGSFGSRLLLPLFFTEHNDGRLFGISEVEFGEEGEARLPTYRCNEKQKRKYRTAGGGGCHHDHRCHLSGPYPLDAWLLSL